MKISNKEKITTKLNRGATLSEIQSLLKDIISDEVGSHPQLSEAMKTYGLELASIINIPVRTAISGQKESHTADSIFSSTVTKAGIGAGAAMITMALLRKTPSIIRVIGGMTGAALAGAALQSIEKPETSGKERLHITSTPDEIEETVDKLISSLKMMDAVNRIEDSDKNADQTSAYGIMDDNNRNTEKEEESVSMSFGDEYSNIIKWLQNIYLETESYGEECAKSIRRKIERILDTVYCTTVHYDGENDSMFEFNDDCTITEALELFPAIVAHSGKIYPGLVSKPFNI